MEAIDITIGTKESPIEHGDARMLSYSCESDFITAPMLLGPQNVCATPIEACAMHVRIQKGSATRRIFLPR